jgi:hypothetical protein
LDRARDLPAENKNSKFAMDPVNLMPEEQQQCLNRVASEYWESSAARAAAETPRPCVILTIPLGSGDAHDARHTVGMLEDALAWQKSDIVATVVAPGVFERGIVREHPDILAAARRAGREAIER